MTRDEIISMAREAGILVGETWAQMVPERATLCNACAKHFAWCKSDPTFSATSDAVVACASFEAAMLIGWKCYFCDYRGNGQYDTFCGNCRRHK